jgi:hypothetical protein
MFYTHTHTHTHTRLLVALVGISLVLGCSSTSIDEVQPQESQTLAGLENRSETAAGYVAPGE